MHWNVARWRACILGTVRAGDLSSNTRLEAILEWIRADLAAMGVRRLTAYDFYGEGSQIHSRNELMFCFDFDASKVEVANPGKTLYHVVGFFIPWFEMSHRSYLPPGGPHSCSNPSEAFRRIFHLPSD